MRDQNAIIPSCPECGAPITHTAPRGLCARCLVSNALSPRGPSADDGFSLRSPEELNQVFPDFEIRRLLGRGGMGAVYEAWQKSLARPVALKLLPPELLESEDFFERFQREARIMAQMDHPNVARVYDSGITDDGEPYIVMELVAGIPITSYVASHQPALRERLELFGQVCSGVQHAHQKGVIHRDLKPSNILVAEVEGRVAPKVIDFGLAKPLEQSFGDETVWLSARHALGTPAYMSPEQAAGDHLDSRSDIYSLGALLYELLTGRALLDDASLRGATRSTIEAAIRRTPVPKPSDGAGLTGPPPDGGSEAVLAIGEDRVAPLPMNPRLLQKLGRLAIERPVLPHPGPLPWGEGERMAAAGKARGGGELLAAAMRLPSPLGRGQGEGKGPAVDSYALSVTRAELRGDLDGIVLKALDKDPARRYETVAALSDDIERHLNHQPVLAIAPSASYLLRKFYRRHRVVLAIAAGLVLFTIIGIGLIVRGSVQARRSERLAAERLRQGERLIDFMLGDLHAKLQTVGRIDVLEATVGEVERFYAQRAASNLSPESLRNQGRAMLRLGQIRNAQGKADAAKRHYEEAIRIYEAAIALRPAVIGWREELGRTWNSLAVFHHMRGEWATAESAYHEALKLAGQLLEAEPDHSDWAEFNASLLHNFASLCEANARLDEAEEKYTEALRLWEPLLARAPDNLKLTENLSHLYLNLAFLQGRRGFLDKVNASNAKALRLRERMVELDPANIRFLSLLADIQQNISEIHLDHGDLAEAEAWINRYRPVREQLAARDPQNAEWQRALADAWRNFAVLQTRRDNLEAAAEAHRKAWEIYEANLGTIASAGVARLRWTEGLKGADETFARLARREKDKGNLDAAQRHWKTLVEIRAKLAGEKADDPQSRHRLALALLDLLAMSLAKGEMLAAKQQAYLALLLLDRSLEAGVTTPLEDNHWKLVRQPAEGAAETTPPGKHDRQSLRAVLAWLAGQTSINTALESQSIHWPSNLAAELQQLAAQR
ncbi:MAG: protein kinase [Verrucomicrobia bacterium]|nr:protein kinase [Verrucomicrobiota bacterium]